MEYIDYATEYVEKYGCTIEETERMVDSDIDSGFIKVEEDYDEYEPSAEDFREWSLACVGLTETDVPYANRYL